MAGRPKKDIDPELVRKLAMIQCTMKEIAACVNCSVDTLERRFADVIQKGQEEGKMSLRRMQFKLAEKNAALAIWLGKQHLNQREPDKLADIENAANTKALLQEVVKGMRNNV